MYQEEMEVIIPRFDVLIVAGPCENTCIVE
jgi:hypothetical protein